MPSTLVEGTPPKKHPVTGCRVDTILGEWLCPESVVQQYVEMAWRVVEVGELRAYSEKSEKMREEATASKRYTIENGVARFKMSGPMSKHPTSMQALFGGCSTMECRDILREIRADPAAKAVFVDADSWGGTAEGTYEMAEAVRKTVKQMPVHFHAEDKATSAMLWVASQATRFTAGPSSSVGSLGTRVTLYDTADLTKDGAAKPIVIKTGKYKAIGHPGIPVTEEDKAEMQRYTDQMNEPFKQDVAKARKLTPEQLAEITTARIYVGQDALRVGLVDAICSSDEALDSLRQNVSQKAAKPGPASGNDHQAVPSRRVAMPLTAEQLKQARELPGAASITEENADMTLLAAATQLKSTTTEQATKISELETKLKGMVPAPTQLPEDVLKAYSGIALERFGLLMEQGKITNGQKDLLTSFVQSADGEPNAFWLTPPAAGAKKPYEQLVDVFTSNKPNGLNQKVADAQPAVRTEPGEVAKKESAPSFDRFNNLRIQSGMSPINEKEYEVRFGKPARS